MELNRLTVKAFQDIKFKIALFRQENRFVFLLDRANFIKLYMKHVLKSPLCFSIFRKSKQNMPFGKNQISKKLNAFSLQKNLVR